MPRLSKIGAAALAAFGWTSGASVVSASYLQVAGGGAGGDGNSGVAGTGGGAGGYLTGTVSLNTTSSYTVIVGAGGSGTSTIGNNGNNSQFSSLTASVGGGGGGSYPSSTGVSGGSGGGGAYNSASGGSGTSGQGNSGGAGTSSSSSGGGGGGGGGAGASGSSGSGTTGGNGGVGLASSISGTSTYYAGGGGGAGVTNGTGGNGGGANGNWNTYGISGTANTGGGGGGGGNGALGGNGGSGIVIISYLAPQKFGGGVVTASGSNIIHTFTTSGTLTPLTSLSASYLVVAGGGGGGGNYAGGGGGGGGLLSGSSVTIDTNSTYIVTVGSGGNYATNGTNSSFLNFTALGGGFGTSYGSPSTVGNGGCGGGGATSTGTTSSGGTGSQGGNGGLGYNNGGYPNGGGGGGASANGSNAGAAIGGNGGIGTASSISGSSVYYAGGGGGGADTRQSSPTQGTGGNGGGANATLNATSNTGGGGGGGNSVGTSGGSGGSGIVIISYPGSTQQMAGGTVTIVGGNVIHTFTSSGYLTPIKYVNNSLRFRSSASAYLNRTPGSSGSQTTFTISMWVKRGSIGSAYNDLFEAYASSSSYADLQFTNTDNIIWYNQTGGTQTLNLTTTAVYRDPSSWYHIVAVYDSSQATSSNRAKIYVNGAQVTAFSTATYPSQNTTSTINSTVSHTIGRFGGASNYLDGYLTEINFIDGQALTPNSFGTFNSYGVWQPISYGGSYGTNGFYLTFTNKTSTTTLGYDFSPNGNNWTTNNISLTAGSTYDSMTDVPTLTSATAANYAVLNPINSTAGLLSQGNLEAYQNVNSTTSPALSTLAVSSGQWYWECSFSGINSGSGYDVFVGIAPSTFTPASENYPGQASGSYGYYSANGQKYTAGSGSSYGATFSNSDIIGVAVDLNSGTLTFYKNNVSQGTAFTGISGGFYMAVSSKGAAIYTNFGQQPFTYTPPTGFVALNTYNL